LTEKGLEVEVVSYLDAREVGRGRIPARRVLGEAVRVRKRMRRFRPDAWLVYTPSVTYPDLFGWCTSTGIGPPRWAKPQQSGFTESGPGTELLGKWLMIWTPWYARDASSRGRRFDQIRKIVATSRGAIGNV
jgi:hypothetical protein